MALVETLQDNFDDNSIAAAWTTSDSGGAVTSETGSTLQMALPSSATSADYASLRSVATYDLTNSAASVQIKQAVSAATAANQTLTLYIDATNYIRFVIEGGTIFFQYRAGGGNVSVSTEAFDINVHSWWRVKQLGTVTHWQSATDGANWGTRAAAVTGLTITAMYVYLEAYCYQNETNPGTAIFDNFNFSPSYGSTAWFKI